MFERAEVPGMPLESLMKVETTLGPENVAPALDLCCVNGHFVIAKHKHGKLRFVLGQVMDIDYDDQSAIVQWWHPELSRSVYETREEETNP